MFLGVPASSIGHIGGGKLNRTGHIDNSGRTSASTADGIPSLLTVHSAIIAK